MRKRKADIMEMVLLKEEGIRLISTHYNNEEPLLTHSKVPWELERKSFGMELVLKQRLFWGLKIGMSRTKGFPC